MTDLRVILYLVIGVAMSVGLSMCGGHYMSLQQQAQQNEQRGRVLDTTSATINDGVIDQQQAQAILDSLNQNRTEFNNAITKAKRHEPETAARADRPVPDSVRDAYRERRRARERLGCVPGECGP